MSEATCDITIKDLNSEMKMSSEGKDISIMPDKAEAVFSRSKLLIPPADLHYEFDRMSSEITGVLSLKNHIIMCIMNGGLMFTGEIMRRVSFPWSLIMFMQVDMGIILSLVKTYAGKNIHQET